MTELHGYTGQGRDDRLRVFLVDDPRSFVEVDPATAIVRGATRPIAGDDALVAVSLEVDTVPERRFVQELDIDELFDLPEEPEQAALHLRATGLIDHAWKPAPGPAHGSTSFPACYSHPGTTHFC